MHRRVHHCAWGDRPNSRAPPGPPPRISRAGSAMLRRARLEFLSRSSHRGNAVEQHPLNRFKATGVLPSRHAADYSDLLNLRDSFVERSTSPWVFRGQPKVFGTLVPSLAREFAGQSALAAEKIESRLMESFRKHYADLPYRGDYMPRPEQLGPGFDLRCLSVMQHYEIPTRLLDWTSNFWTAVYFACASDPGQDAELWGYNQRCFVRQRELDPTLQTLIDTSETPPPEPPLLRSGKKDLLVELDPRTSPRMKQQVGHHTVSSNILADHLGLFTNLRNKLSPNRKASILLHVIIDGRGKTKILQNLALHENITAGTVFPDVVGLSRFLKWEFEYQRELVRNR
jgi:hypothetical protein